MIIIYKILYFQNLTPKKTGKRVIHRTFRSPKNKKSPELFMFSARNLDLSEVSLNTSRELEAYIIIKT